MCLAVTYADAVYPVAISARHADPNIYSDVDTDRYADPDRYPDGNIYTDGITDLWPRLHNVVDNGNVDCSD